MDGIEFDQQICCSRGELGAGQALQEPGLPQSVQFLLQRCIDQGTQGKVGVPFAQPNRLTQDLSLEHQRVRSSRSCPLVHVLKEVLVQGLVVDEVKATPWPLPLRDFLEPQRGQTGLRLAQSNRVSKTQTIFKRFLLVEVGIAYRW